MATTDEEKKILTQEELEAQRAANIAAAQAAQNAQAAQQAQDAAAAQAGAPTVAPTPGSTPAPDETRQQLADAYDQQYKSFYDIAMQKKADLDAARAEDLQHEQELRKAAAWTGAGELATSLANLIGVGSFNSANQTYKNYSTDWMNKAEEARKARITRRDNMKAQLDSLNAQLGALKSGKANALATYDIKKKQQDISQQKADAYTKWQMARLELNDARAELTAAQAELARARAANVQADIDQANRRLDIAQQNANTAQDRAETARLEYDRKSSLTESEIAKNNAAAEASRANAAYKRAKTPGASLELDEEYPD